MLFKLVLISGRGVFPLSEPDLWDEVSAIVALCLSRAADKNVVDAVEHCLLWYSRETGFGDGCG